MITAISICLAPLALLAAGSVLGRRSCSKYRRQAVESARARALLRPSRQPASLPALRR